MSEVPLYRVDGLSQLGAEQLGLQLEVDRCVRRGVFPGERDWQFIAKQPASAPHMLRIGS